MTKYKQQYNSILPFLLKFVLFIFSIIIFFYFFKRTNWHKEKKNEYNRELFKLRVKERKKNKNLSDIYYLARKYQEGVPDVFSDGKVIKGIKPDYEKSIKYYQYLNGTEYHYHTLIPLGDIYYYEYTNLQDYKKCREYYLQSLKAHDLNIRLEGIEKIQQLNRDENLPVLHDIAIETDRHRVIGKEEPEGIPNIPENIIIKNPIKNDTQNVHDVGVNNSYKVIISDLRKIPFTIDKDKTIMEIVSYINKKGDSEENKRAIKTLRTMNSSNVLITNVNLCELEILSLLWNKINSLNDDDKKNVKENLITQLSEANEFDNIVCAKGRVSHCLACLDVLGDKNNQKVLPLWSIKQEMYNKAAKFRNENQHMNDMNFKDSMKRIFMNDYINLVSESFIEKEVNSWV